ncbi:unnamed protein product [Peniophora sp. CBMAI 1063]|nr:unnamed protein product [Peniophora sp. CBMAI 1063]
MASRAADEQGGSGSDFELDSETSIPGTPNSSELPTRHTINLDLGDHRLGPAKRLEPSARQANAETAHITRVRERVITPPSSPKAASSLPPSAQTRAPPFQPPPAPVTLPPKGPTPPVSTTAPRRKKKPNMGFQGEPFTGERGDDPVDFWRRFDQWSLDSEWDDAKTLRAFKSCLKSGSKANDWFLECETNSTITNASSLESQFNTKYPALEKAKKTADDLAADLMALRLKEADLGRTVKVGGVEMWAHRAYATEAIELAKEAGISSTTASITIIRDNLPKAIRRLVKSKHVSLEAFFTAINALDPDTVKEEAEFVREIQEEAEKSADARVQMLMANMSLGSNESGARSRQGARTTQSAPASNSNTPRAPQSNPPVTQSRPAGTPPARNGPLPPPTAEQRARLEQAATVVPPNRTPQAMAKYEADMAAFTARFGSRPYITYDTPVPLRPGGPMLAYSECFNCGNINHYGADCPHRLNAAHPDRLPGPESRWRALVGTVLKNVNRPRRGNANSGADILFTGQDDGGFNGWANTPGYEMLEQGNASGSA